MEQTKIDKPVFFISAAVLLVVSILFLSFPEQSSNIIQKLFHHTLHNFGFIYTWAGILVIVAMLFFSFSYFGKIKFGNTKPRCLNARDAYRGGIPSLKESSVWAVLFIQG